jgi:hypothetical protein
MMNEWKNWASSLMDALLASDAETKEVVTDTFRAKPLSDHCLSMSR